MTNNEALTFGAIDRDGALQETAERAGVTRGDALRRAVLGGSALVGASALLAGVPGTALASTKSSSRVSSDVDILNFALTLEYLEAAFYAEAVSAGKLSGEAKKFAAQVAKDEAAHVAFLKGALGSKAVAKPMFDFKGTTGKQGTFLKTAMVLEDTGVSAYAGAAPMITDKKTLSAALVGPLGRGSPRSVGPRHHRLRQRTAARPGGVRSGPLRCRRPQDRQEHRLHHRITRTPCGPDTCVRAARRGKQRSRSLARPLLVF